MKAIGARKRGAARWPAALAGALALLFAPHCTSEGALQQWPVGEEGGGGGEIGAGVILDESPGVTLTAATWQLTWDLGATVPEAGGGWSVETDLGYRVRVTSGWLHNYSGSFGPCDAPAADGGTSWLPLRFGVPAAHAHESQDPSEILLLHADDLANPKDTGVRPNTFAPTRYCRVHWLVARAASPSDAPAGIDLTQTSLRIEAAWERGEASGKIAVDTWWPQGHLDDLDALIPPDQLAAAKRRGSVFAAHVVVERHLDRLFDGIDLETASDAQIAGTMIDNIVSTAEIAVELWNPDS